MRFVVFENINIKTGEFGQEGRGEKYSSITGKETVEEWGLTTCDFCELRSWVCLETGNITDHGEGGSAG